ncbi:lysine--tRNA ligase [Boudabousia liubingyangii]|uniref:Lysine--tRNA ligase n=1 Tax=Boudabousia liubingyangii TaxID=1921764 RepID=A0A1Q5PN86_9ACTO|nr:bifunctional lysylphosphatidylglycerol synthetase/lysine--tRNA ligase LysX [Boudabousia liubingyangii]OKL48935.1 lysine--tRNA ligase [Boudabousia liubingyangii]
MPAFVGHFLYVSAIISLVGFAFPRMFSEQVYTVLNIALQFGVPIGYSLFTVLILTVLAAASFRRKRIVLWLLWIHWSITGLTDLAIMITTDRDPFSLTFDVLGLVSCLFLLTVTIRSREAFAAKTYRHTFMTAVLWFLFGIAVTFGVGYAGVQLLHPEGMNTPRALRWILARIIGQDFLYYSTISDVFYDGPQGLGVIISLFSTLVATIALVIFLRGNRAQGSSREEDLKVRQLLVNNPADSLGYYATRSDRAVVFAPNGQAAVSYATSSGTAIAASDPLGNPQYWPDAVAAWLRTCDENGWVAGALSLSEQGARTFKEFGFQIHKMGDEAIIETKDFSLLDPRFKDLKAAVRRAKNHGVEITVRRLREIPEAEREELVWAANTYREGSERGFTMSLDRILDAEDEDTMIVLARDDKQIHGLLTFVPWGPRGLSLNLMRRNPASVNGVVEAMVVALIMEGRDVGIERISMNFAMFRQAFVSGQAVDAGFFKRLVLVIMRLGSRFWQLESLYESNARYYPVWFSRFLGIRHGSQAVPVMLASGRLEGFVPNIGVGEPAPRTWATDEDYLQAIRAQKAQELQVLPPVKLTQQEQVRRQKAADLEARGREAYPPGIPAGDPLASVRAEAEKSAPGMFTTETLTTAGRISAIRNHGGVIFLDLYQGRTRLQLVADRRVLSGRDFIDLKTLDRGDQLQVTGQPGRTKRGEPSLQLTTWKLRAKALRPLPVPGTVLDPQTRVRQRALHLLVDPGALDLLRARGTVFRSVREYLTKDGYLEVETPVLQAVQGGANARPFVTHLNAYDSDVFLRIAPELYLKRLAVAGLDRIFEMGRSFRNEGADATHNPEFTSLEAYRAGADYHDMQRLTEALIKAAATALYGQPACLRPQVPAHLPKLEAPADQHQLLLFARQELGEEAGFVDLSAPWPVITVLDAISQAVGSEITLDTPIEELKAHCQAHGLALPATINTGELIGVLYDELVEAKTELPTFYTDFPVETSPLTRQSRKDPRLAERWDLVAFGMELGTAYTELTDPRIQRERLTRQSLAAAAGDPEAMSLDEDFLRTLELGLPGTGGLGIGMDRLVMFLTGTNIRQTLSFPFVKPQENN